MSEINPVGTNLLVKKFEKTKKTAGGLLLPDSSNENVQKGVVVKIGEGCYETDYKSTPTKFSVCEGDIVAFNAGFGVEIEDNGKKFILLPKQAVLATIGE